MTLAALYERKRELENRIRTIQDRLPNLSDELRALVEPDRERMLARYHAMQALATRWEAAERERSGYSHLLEALECNVARSAVAAKLSVAESAVAECKAQAKRLIGETSNVVALKRKT